MSNVLYKCPTCGSRMFGAPGGTKLHCPHHPDTLYIQVEQYVGPNFEFVDPDQGRGHTATGVLTDPTLKNITTVRKTVREEVSDQEVKERLRRRYEELYKERPDMRWGPNKLRRLVTIKEEELEAKVKAEFEDKKALEG